MNGPSDFQAQSRLIKIAGLVRDKATSDSVPPGSSQLASVALELAMSVSKAADAGRDSRFDDEEFLNDFVDTESDRVRDVLLAIPSAFHHFSLKTGDGKDVNPFELRVPELNEAVKDIVDLEPKKVLKAFGTIWSHTRVLDEIRSAETPQFRKELCFHPSDDGLSYVAQLYLDAEDLISPLLEAALIDALMHRRILDFASSCAFVGLLPGTPDGQLIDGPLLPGSSSSPMGAKLPSILGILGQGIAEITLNLAVEVVVLAATWGISVFLAGSEGLAKWILFTGVTSARWVAIAIRGKGDAVRERDAKAQTNLQMLWDMAIAHERVPSLNVGLLRHLLFKLEERGAGFNPAVYSILDRRARREARLDLR